MKIKLIILLLLCQGCASGAWYKKGQNHAAYYQDRSNCEWRVRTAGYPVILLRDKFDECMYGQGWRWITENDVEQLNQDQELDRL